MNNIKYEIDISQTTFSQSIHRLINQIYKLLPDREEGSDWKKPLDTIIEEIAGMHRIFYNQNDILFTILCKLEGLFTLNEDKDFMLYRRTIFEILNLLSGFEKRCMEEIIFL